MGTRACIISGMKAHSRPTLLLVVILLCAACASPDATAMPSPTATRVDLTPSTTPSPSPTLTLTPIITSTEEPRLPTPTPFTYTVREGDTLYGIALRFDTTVDEIITANPDLSSNVLSIGTQLIIPAGEGGLTPELSTPTPIPVALSKPICYPSNEEGLWCFVSASNEQNTTLENVSALLNLHIPTGEIAASKIAIPPLNLFKEGSRIPLSAYFPPPLPDSYQVYASLLTALPSDEESISLPIQDKVVSLDENGCCALVKGKVSLENVDQTAVQQIWVAAVAFDDDGQVVGVRKWVSDEIGSTTDLQNLAFAFYVYSLGPPIAEIQLLTELY